MFNLDSFRAVTAAPQCLQGGYEPGLHSSRIRDSEQKLKGEVFRSAMWRNRFPMRADKQHNMGPNI